MGEKLYNATAKCGVCDKVLNTAENVPESQKSKVSFSAPMMSICEVKEHNTFPDLNLKVKIEWKEVGT